MVWAVSQYILNEVNIEQCITVNAVGCCCWEIKFYIVLYDALCRSLILCVLW